MEFEVKEQYRNMREVLDKYPKVYEFAMEAMKNLEENLVSYWPCDGTSLDQYGANHGRKIGGSVTGAKGKFGDAILFERDNDFIEIESESEQTFDNARRTTISLWPSSKPTRS